MKLFSWISEGFTTGFSSTLYFPKLFFMYFAQWRSAFHPLHEISHGSPSTSSISWGSSFPSLHFLYFSFPIFCPELGDSFSPFSNFFSTNIPYSFIVYCFRLFYPVFRIRGNFDTLHFPLFLLG
jgi:hypothetical protein